MNGLYIGVEIGASKHQICLADAAGKILKMDSGKVELEKGAAGILAWMKEHISAMIESRPAGSEIVAVAVGFGGIIETATGVSVISVQVDGWKDFNIKAWFESAFQVPCFVLNDTVAGGFAEYYAGSGVGCENFFYTNIGSGIGGVFFLNGTYYDGSGYGAAYFGHTYIPDWTRTDCNSYDKVENLCSGFGIQNRLRKPGYVPHDSKMLELAGGDASRISGLTLELAAKEGDAFALAEIDRIARGYSVGLDNVITLIHPQIVSIGGGIANMGDMLLDPVRKYTDEKVFISAKGKYKIVKCALGNDVVPVGAVIYAAKEMKNRESGV